jgi:hypothetical protein
MKSCRTMMVVQWLGLATIEQAHAQSTSEVTAPNKRRGHDVARLAGCKAMDRTG